MSLTVGASLFGDGSLVAIDLPAADSATVFFGRDGWFDFWEDHLSASAADANVMPVLVQKQVVNHPTMIRTINLIAAFYVGSDLLATETHPLVVGIERINRHFDYAPFVGGPAVRDNRLQTLPKSEPGSVPRHCRL